MPPTYRHRLRLEGGWLAALGAAGSIALIATVDESRRWPLNTVGQLAVVAGLAGALGTRKAKKQVAAAADRRPSELGTGEPTPLWMHPLIVVSLAAAFPLTRELGGPDAAGFDASLRITGGCVVVGLTQAVLIERIVARAEREQNRTFFRAKGSQGTKTVLEATPASPRACARR